jgi:hypothetical protein
MFFSFFLSLIEFHRSYPEHLAREADALGALDDGEAAALAALLSRVLVRVEGEHGSGGAALS